MVRDWNTDDPRPESLYRFAEAAGLLDDAQVRRLLEAAVGTSSSHRRRQIRDLLVQKARRQADQPFAPGDSEAGGGQIRLGQVASGGSLTLGQDALTQHLLAVGQSGAGKTTLFYNLMLQVDVPFWSFDVKQDYRHLAAQEAVDVVVLPWTELKFNPLQPPPGVGPRRWAQVISEIFGHATSLLSGSKNHLMKQIIELYRLYDLFDSVSPPFPSLHELHILVERENINYVRKTSNYRDTVLNRLEAMNLTAGTIFDCSQGYPLNELLDRNVVFEFDGLGRDLQNFLMEALFAAVYEYRVAQNQRGGALRHLFFLDEGKQVFSVYKERQDAAGIPAIDTLTARMREFGEGLVVADQEASKLTESIKANTATKILLATGDHTQFREMSASMGLSERQAAIAEDLGVGEAVVQTEGGGDPFAVDLDKVDVAKRLSDEALRNQQQDIWDELASASREITVSFRGRLGEEDQDTRVEPATPDDASDTVELSDVGVQLLNDVVTHPFKSLTDRYALFDNDYEANQVKNELVDAGVVRERTLTIGAEQHKLLELTEDGKEYLAEEEDTEVERKGKGGIVHRYWQHQIRDAFELAGWTAKLELFDADVYVHMGEKELAVEVAMGNNDREVDHVQQRLDQGLDEVWVVCPNTTIISQLKEKMEKQGVQMERVEFRRLRDFKDTEIFKDSELAS